MASIYLRSSVYWGRATVAGVEHRKSLETASRPEAESRLKQWVEYLKNPQPVAIELPERTFESLAMLFIDKHLPRLKPNSIKRYEQSIRRLIALYEGRDAMRFTAAALAEFETARRAQGVQPATIRRDLACLSSMLSLAPELWGDDDLVVANPVPAYLKRHRKTLREGEPGKRYLTKHEEVALLEAVKDIPVLWQNIAVAIDTGLRSMEQFALRIKNVDLVRERITVPADEAKSHLSRTVPLRKRSVEILREVIAGRKTGYVWTNPATGKHYTRFTRGLAGAVKRAGVEPIVWHDLRRTCGCRLLQDDQMALAGVSRWLGHQTVAQTQRAYAFLEIDNLHDAIRRDPPVLLAVPGGHAKTG
ncbi:tyrosine-type recombinase/integrase [Skermanella pratensis]|uniref:tyrosine-type recombinase/integrase n=1 Tax=Skermanella pratensis TaxID=2233999 RepID=UPI001300FBB9|nr:site-specific integrase [Skermanella pratensis]